MEILTSTFPSIMVPISRYFAAIGIIKGALIFLSKVCMESRYSSKLGASAQGATDLGIRSLIPRVCCAAMGMKVRSVLGL